MLGCRDSFLSVSNTSEMPVFSPFIFQWSSEKLPSVPPSRRIVGDDDTRAFLS